MSLLPEVEHALTDAVADAAPAAPRTVRAAPRRTVRIALVALAATLMSATALAATGTIHVPGFSRAPAAHRAMPILGTDRTATLAAYRGRTLIVTFYASWCTPCVRQAQLVDRAAARLEAAGTGTAVLIGFNDRAADARWFAARYGLRLTTLRDPHGAVAREYDITGIPATFVIDAQGRLVSVARGAQTRRSLARDIARAERRG